MYNLRCYGNNNNNKYDMKRNLQKKLDYTNIISVQNIYDPSIPVFLNQKEIFYFTYKTDPIDQLSGYFGNNYSKYMNLNIQIQ